MMPLEPDASHRVAFDESKRGPVVDIATAVCRSFDVCPICLDPEPASREHVPPRQIGGKFMTLTCGRCNNRFGSLYERDLADWFHDRVGFSVALEEGQKFRVGGRMLVRKKDDGKPTFEIYGPLKPHIVEILNSERTQLVPRLPSYRAVQVAILKSAYLAVVLLIGRIPGGTEPDAIRELLVAARDYPTSPSWPNEHLLADVRFSQTFLRATGLITLGITRQTTGVVDLVVGLAGTVYARFPLEHNWSTVDATGESKVVNISEVFERFIEEPSAWSGRSSELGTFEFNRAPD
jgi:hypothetical protein